MRCNRNLPPDIRSLTLVVALLGLIAPRIGVAQQALQKRETGQGPVLQPGDLVKLVIWREPDLSGSYRVNERGVATFPKIGPLPVNRISTDSLESLLVSSYAAYLQNPSIDVTFLRRVNVLGEVKSPGLYDVDPTMTVNDVLALAGGVTSEGNLKKI